MKIIKFNGDKLITGINSLEYLKELDIESACIISGKSSMRKNGVIDKIKEYIKTPYEISGIPINPNQKVILDGVKKLREYKTNVIIAVGGGSCIDAAKIITYLYEYGDLDFDDLINAKGPEERVKTKLIAIPSTSGTGTEVTKASVITFEDLDLKVGLKSFAFIPDIAVLDPKVTLSMPSEIVAQTGMDALTHAIECYINPKLDDFTEVLARGAIEGIFKYLPLSYEENTLEAREKVHNYQSMAGLAFHNVGLGMDHGIAHAFGGKYNLGHGLLNGVALPYVLQFNIRDIEVSNKLKSLSDYLGFNVIEGVKSLNNELNIPRTFYDLGISEDIFINDLEWLIQNSLKGSTRSNPVKVEEEDMKMILESIYYGYDIKN